ncbi:MAG: hypothetical protein ACOZBX_03215, partial [Campylobacterota bacterium]
MKFLFVLFAAVCFLRAADATIEVVKGVESLPKLAVEDASAFKSDATVRMSKMLVADMQVVSLFDVDANYAAAPYESTVPAPVHKDAQYLLRYRLHDDGNGGMKADVRLIRNGQELFAKSYVLKQSEMMVFLAHSIAYDINAKMGGTPMEWMKR